MKKLLFLLSALCLFPFCACGTERGGEVFTLTVTADAALSEPFLLEIFDAEGSLGKTQAERGKNLLPRKGLPYYLNAAVPKEYDCPVVRADGSDLSLAVKRAEFSETEGYLHAYTVFLEHADAETFYLLTVCKTGSGEADYCKTAEFFGDRAAIPLADGTYTLDLIADGETVCMKELIFDFAAQPRFCVLDAAKG